MKKAHIRGAVVGMMQGSVILFKLSVIPYQPNAFR
jgi:hypothetical protein